MIEKRKNYSLSATFNGEGNRVIGYREKHEGGVLSDGPTDSRVKNLLDFIRKLAETDPDIRLTLEARNYI